MVCVAADTVAVIPVPPADTTASRYAFASGSLDDGDAVGVFVGVDVVVVVGVGVAVDVPVLVGVTVGVLVSVLVGVTVGVVVVVGVGVGFGLT
jgi:hypothetical protein